MHPHMEISRKQTSLFTGEKSMCYQVDSLASLTPMQAQERAKMMNVTSGRNSLEQSKKFDRLGYWEKTFAELLIGTGDWFSMKCRLIWRLKGTKSRRLYFQLAVSELTTSEKGFGFVATPAAWDGKMYKVTLEGANTRANTQRGPGRAERGGIKKQMSWIHQAILFYGFKKCTANPRFSMWMMGYPLNWTELPFQNGSKNPFGHQVTQSSHK